MDTINYLFDSTEILKKRRILKRQLLEQNKHFLEKRIAILSGSTIGDIKDVLELFLLSFGIKPHFFVGQYNRFYEDIMFDNKEIIDFKPDIIYMHTSARNLSDTSLPEKLKAVWEKIRESYGCSIIQNNFELMPYAAIDKNRQINALNIQLEDYANELSNFYVNDMQRLAACVGLDNWFNEQDYYLYKYTFSVTAIPFVCYNIAKIIKSLYGKNQKCIVLDLDNTLWGGVVGDVGTLGIALGPETALGEAYVAFQKYVKNLYREGIILAVCSKNDEKIAKEAFRNPYMVLRLDDIAVFCANWNSKAENILYISEQLNILPESIVFIDDNPAEREMVRQSLPEVKVPEVSDVSDFIWHIEKAGYFYATSVSDDDKKRNDYYAADAKRKDAKQSYIDYSEYLRSLHMSSVIKSFNAEALERITQLINKTNQFNLTTKRYSQSDLDKIAFDNRFITLFATLDDKFGTNGIVSALIGEIIEDSLHICLWVMSCRVFKRDLELAIFDSLVDICSKKGLGNLVGYYYQTEKNGYVSGLFDDLGFNKTAADTWEFEITAEYKFKNETIKLKKDAE